MACCLVCINYAFRMGIADTQAYKARYLLEQWEREQRLPTKGEADEAVAAVTLALRWEPDNTEYMDLKAHVLTYKGLLNWDAGDFVGVTTESVQLYLLATKYRPKWPYAWARLALVKSYRGEYDDVFVQALENAVLYGPWEPGVQVTVAEAGLYAWVHLNSASKSHVVSNIQRGLSYKYKEMSGIIKRFNRKNSICASLLNTSKTARLCGW